MELRLRDVALSVLAVPVFIAGWLVMLILGALIIYGYTLLFMAAWTLVTTQSLS